MSVNVLRIRRSDYGKEHRKAYEYGHSREYGVFVNGGTLPEYRRQERLANDRA